MRTIEIRWKIAGNDWSMASSGEEVKLVRNETVFALTRAECRTLADELTGLASDPGGPLPAKAGKPWVAADDDLLVQRWKKGETILDIATEFKRTKGAIKSRLMAQGLATKEDLALA